MTDTMTTTEPTCSNLAASPASQAHPAGLDDALAAIGTADVDSLPTVRIQAAYRDISCSGSGPECYRRVRYPHQESGTEWPDSDRLPACDGLAGTRRASVSCEVPIGTVVVDYERQVYKGKRGRCSVTIGIAYADADGDGKVHWIQHRTLRSKPVYEVTLPYGLKIEIERRD
jgi:hypothetical protein